MSTVVITILFWLLLGLLGAYLANKRWKTNREIAPFVLGILLGPFTLIIYCAILIRRF